MQYISVFFRTDGIAVNKKAVLPQGQDGGEKCKIYSAFFALFFLVQNTKKMAGMT